MSKSSGEKDDQQKGQPNSIEEALRKLDAALRQPSASISEIASDDYAHIKTAVADVSSQVIEHAVDALGNTGEALKDMSRQGVQELAKAAQGVVTELSRQGGEALRKADRQVRANPWAPSLVPRLLAH